MCDTYGIKINEINEPSIGDNVYNERTNLYKQKNLYETIIEKLLNNLNKVNDKINLLEEMKPDCPTQEPKTETLVFTVLNPNTAITVDSRYNFYDNSTIITTTCKLNEDSLKTFNSFEYKIHGNWIVISNNLINTELRVVIQEVL